MHITHRFVGITLGLFIVVNFAACGGGKPPLKPAATPQELANQVVASLKANDFAAFRALCFSKEDVDGWLKFAKGEEKRASLKDRAERSFTPGLETYLRTQFDLAVRSIDWKTATIKKTDVGKETQEPDEPPTVSRTTIELDSGWKVVFNNQMTLDRGWVIGVNPIQVYDANGKLVDGKSSNQVPVYKNGTDAKINNVPGKDGK